jgi:hypothetical protein
MMAFSVVRMRSRCGGFEQVAVGAVALAFQVIERDEAKGGGVDAVAQAPGFGGPIAEHMAQVTVAVGREDLSPDHPVAEVPTPDHVTRLDRTVKLGLPSGGIRP